MAYLVDFEVDKTIKRIWQKNLGFIDCNIVILATVRYNDIKKHYDATVSLESTREGKMAFGHILKSEPFPTASAATRSLMKYKDTFYSKKLKT